MPIVSTVEGNIITLTQAGRYVGMVQGCNTHHAMGSGLAPQVAKAWPGAEQADFDTVKGDISKLGNFSYYKDNTINSYIINAYTQHYFRTKPDGSPAVDYKAVADVFGRFNSLFYGVGRNDFYSDNRRLAVPQIGCGLAKGDWQAVKTIIDLVTPDIEIELVMYKP